jgi:NADH:ubiquinone oxidoreductase subunit 5 (subunit L)/multisubunit Na+/H+ antiporter MnhA subunit
MMNTTLFTILSFPLLGALSVALILTFQRINQEKSYFWLVLPIYFTQIVGELFLLFSSYQNPISIHLPVIALDIYHYSLDFLVTPSLCVLGLSISSMFLIIQVVSRRYLHAEEEQGKFYILKLLFNFAILSFIFATNIDFLFYGWEIVGLTSVLLIAYFYRRNQAVENSQFAFAIYRFCDASFLILCLLLFFYYKTDNILFNHVEETQKAIFSLLIFIAILGKSGVYPLNSWLPLALEGPTPSSGLYYSAMSTHLGAIFLLKTEGLWRGDGLAFYLLIGFSVLLIISTFINTLSAKAQPSAKGAIVYATMAHVSVIILEILWGFKFVAIIHLSLHMFYRFTQLLLSPSAIDRHQKAESAKGSTITGSSESFFVLKKRMPSSFYFQALNGFGSEKLMKDFFTLLQKPFSLIMQLENKIFDFVHSPKEKK